MDAPFRPVRASVHDQVRDHLQDLIQTEEYKPGFALPAERELAAQMGVSRHSLRQAIASLEAVGLVETRQGAGVYVTTHLPDEAVIRVANVLYDVDRSITDIVEARLGIEPFIAHTAAERRTEEDLASLKVAIDMNDAQIALVPGKQSSGLSFHQQVASAARNPVLDGILRSLITGPRTMARLSSRDTHAAGDWHEAHENIYNAICDGDGRRARDLMQNHLKAVVGLARRSENRPPENEDDASEHE